MAPRTQSIVQAWLESPQSGVIELTHDWTGRQRPPVMLCKSESCVVLANVEPLPGHYFGDSSGYFAAAPGEICFFVPIERHPEVDPEKDSVYLAGDFNDWGEAIGQDEWCLKPGVVGGRPVLLWSGLSGRFDAVQRFKFVTGRGVWLSPQDDGPNVIRDDKGNLNYQFDPARTGNHLFRFDLAGPMDLAQSWTVGWADQKSPKVPLRPGGFFYELGTRLPLGAMVNGNETLFRLFAPRARDVELIVCPNPGAPEHVHRYALHRRKGEPATWEIVLEGNLHGWGYWYSVDGPNDGYGEFHPQQRILDPYAKATMDRNGPGIVLDPNQLAPADRDFATPAWQDLIIAEAHVRDLVAQAPLPLSDAERLGFAGLTRWVESPAFYLHQLGVNAVELQPLQEFDNPRREDYHWGYMTNNFFAPESSYSLDPVRASGVRELQDLVRAFHRRGIAVILDVVYNHVGEPAHLLLIDKLYYFEVDNAGQLSNWSGCGNDLRCRSRMTRRMIGDSLVHLVETYGVDGFRFDLAELIGREVLEELEQRLKRVKPDIILIAEPWSFRGHIAGELRDTGYASWNDGYRDFLREYVRGGGSREQFQYFLRGSPWYFAKWPAQTVNYTESHDDRTWIDVITENLDGSGQMPTGDDRRRTHLMAAILFSSIGIPMLSAGQDFLRSKHGVNNTYQRGDLNALEYRRLYRFPGTHAYFAAWIAFRLSEPGQLLRHYSRASERFFRFHHPAEGTAAAVVYNADFSQGKRRLLFAVNPTLTEVALPLEPETVSGRWRQLADAEHFYGPSGHGAHQPVEPELFLPALACGLWISNG